MNDEIYTSQIVSEVIETNGSLSIGATRLTQASVEVIESQTVTNNIRSSQMAVEVILTRYDIVPRFIGWGAPIA